MPMSFKRWRHGLIRRNRAVFERLRQTPCAESHARPEDAQAIVIRHFRPARALSVVQNPAPR